MTMAWGCGGLFESDGIINSIGVSGMTADDEARLTRARHQVEEGQLADALVEYKALTLASGDDPTIRQERTALENKIAEVASTRYDQGAKAMKAGRTKAARTHFLAALAADPHQREPFLALRAIETKRARRVQKQYGLDTVRGYGSESKPAMSTPATSPNATDTNDDESSKEQAAIDAAIEHLQNGQYTDTVTALEPALGSPETKNRAEQLLTNAYLEQARQLTMDGDLEKAEASLGKAAASQSGPLLSEDIEIVRNELANAYYERGLMLFSTDLNSAIAAWRKSIALDPTLSKSAQVLQRAEKLQAIRAASAN
jgi:tetratricopeptide (TPR) repeat protein